MALRFTTGRRLLAINRLLVACIVESAVAPSSLLFPSVLKHFSTYDSPVTHRDTAQDILQINILLLPIIYITGGDSSDQNARWTPPLPPQKKKHSSTYILIIVFTKPYVSSFWFMQYICFPVTGELRRDSLLHWPPPTLIIGPNKALTRPKKTGFRYTGSIR